jgi:RNA polymerase sigma factor (sigma-70 family)
MAVLQSGACFSGLKSNISAVGGLRGRPIRISVIRLRYSPQILIFSTIAIRRYPANIMNITELYTAARDGDKASEHRLFAHLGVSFRAFARLKGMDGSDADDVVQTTLLKIAETYRQTDIHTSFAGWAHAILRNHMMDHFRSRNLDRRKTEELTQRRTFSGNPDSNPGLLADLKSCLTDLHERNKSYARVLMLNYKGYTTAEICEELRIKPGNLYAILSRARASLRECLKRKGVLGV